MPKLETREKAKKAWDLRPNLSIGIYNISVDNPMILK